MIEKINLVESKSFFPYQNQAVEEFLFNHVCDTELILYFWQNDNTVVLGRNQNAWKECNCSQLEIDGGYIARRISGGGAVFHDKGNLNFTFVCNKTNYSVEKQMNVILNAIQSFGVKAICTGRNDVSVDGKKISGNAYYNDGTHFLHHGTLLLTSSKDSIDKYLTVSKNKLLAKGVDSVKARVAVLSEYISDISINKIKEAVVNSVKIEYGLDVIKTADCFFADNEIKLLQKKFASWEWKYGRKIPFTIQTDGNFAWGEVIVELNVNEGIIKEAIIWSDALNVTIIKKIADSLKNTYYIKNCVVDAILSIEESENNNVSNLERNEIHDIVYDLVSLLEKIL